eukprot:1153963-Pelagomonas_calceolata.AAC.4
MEQVTVDPCELSADSLDFTVYNAVREWRRLKPAAEEAVVQLKSQARRKAREEKARKAQVGGATEWEGPSDVSLRYFFGHACWDARHVVTKNLFSSVKWMQVMIGKAGVAKFNTNKVMCMADGKITSHACPQKSSTEEVTYTHVLVQEEKQRRQQEAEEAEEARREAAKASGSRGGARASSSAAAAALTNGTKNSTNGDAGAMEEKSEEDEGIEVMEERDLDQARQLTARLTGNFFDLTKMDEEKVSALGAISRGIAHCKQEGGC